MKRDKGGTVHHSPSNPSRGNEGAAQGRKN